MTVTPTATATAILPVSLNKNYNHMISSMQKSSGKKSNYSQQKRKLV